jgi:hypothetical protein
MRTLSSSYISFPTHLITVHHYPSILQPMSEHLKSPKVAREQE